MDFAAFELDRTFVIEALRRGEIDYLENLSEAAEADFFRHLIGRDALTRLAETYPTPRKKEEVPVWLYIASQISLKLHDASYHAFPYTVNLFSMCESPSARILSHPQVVEDDSRLER